MKPLAKGVLSYAVPGFRTVHSYGNPLGTISALSCYSIYLRHISILRAAGVRKMPKVVAELGPGSSLGTGYAALIAGAEKYYALDLVGFSDPASSLAVFDALVDLFRRKAAVPSSGVHSRRFPDLDNYDFPDFLPVEPDKAFETRVAAIRRDIAARGGIFVESAAPWTETSIQQPSSVDWIFSQSVLEHVDELALAYRSLARWLKPGGHMSHLIDFDSHGLTREWNGHWALKDRTWSALRGRRPYLINRRPYAGHLRLAAENGLFPILEKRNKRFDGLIPEQFAPRFRDISDEDARTRMVHLVSRRSG